MAHLQMKKKPLYYGGPLRKDPVTGHLVKESSAQTYMFDDSARSTALYYRWGRYESERFDTSHEPDTADLRRRAMAEFNAAAWTTTARMTRTAILMTSCSETGPYTNIYYDFFEADVVMRRYAKPAVSASFPYVHEIGINVSKLATEGTGGGAYRLGFKFSAAADDFPADYAEMAALTSATVTSTGINVVDLRSLRIPVASFSYIMVFAYIEDFMPRDAEYLDWTTPPYYNGNPISQIVLAYDYSSTVPRSYIRCGD